MHQRGPPLLRAAQPPAAAAALLDGLEARAALEGARALARDGEVPEDEEAVARVADDGGEVHGARLRVDVVAVAQVAPEALDRVRVGGLLQSGTPGGDANRGAGVARRLAARMAQQTAM